MPNEEQVPMQQFSKLRAALLASGRDPKAIDELLAQLSQALVDQDKYDKWLQQQYTVSIGELDKLISA